MKLLLVLFLMLLAQPGLAYYSPTQVVLSSPAYASLHVAGTVAINCAVQDTYYEIGSGWTVDATSNCGASTAGDVTLSVSGTYLVLVSAAQDGVNAHNNEFCLHDNGAEATRLETLVTQPSGSAYVAVSGVAIITGVAGHVLDVRVADKSGTGTVNFQRCHFIVARIGP